MSEPIEVQEEGLIKYEKKALSRVNPLRKKLNALRETYKEEPDLNTTAGYKKYREAIAAFRTLKGETEKERKDVKAVLNRIATAVDDSYNGVWDDAEKEQKERDAKLKEFDAEKERVKKEKDEAEQKVLIERTALLTGMGATVVDGHMVLNGYSLKLDQIKSSPEQVWQDAILKSFKEQYDIVEAERAEEERKEQERQEQLRQEQETIRQQQEDLRKEQEEMRQQRFELRRDRLLALGMDKITNAVKYKAVAGAVVTVYDMLNLSNEEFNSVYHTVSSLIQEAKTIEEERKEQERIAEERKKLMQDRTDELKVLGLYPSAEKSAWVYEKEVCVFYEDIGNMSENNWESLIDEITPVVSNAKAEAERKRREELERQHIENERLATENTRLQMLKSIDTIVDQQEVDLGSMSDFDWQMFYAGHKSAYDQKQHEKWLKEQNERRELEELKEKERLADMTDGEKWRNWKNELTKFQSEMPDFSTKRYGKMKAIALEKFSEIHLLKAAKISSN